MRAGSRLGVQLRVLFALVMREMATRYGKTAGGYVWAVADPVIFILMMAAIFSEFAHAPPLGEHFALFYASGYMAFHIYLDISGAVSGSVQFNRPLFSFPRVTPLDTVLARFILQFLTCCIVTAILFGGLLTFSDDQVAVDPGPIMLAMALAALLGFGVGALNCVLFAYSPTWQRIFNLINRPLFIVSGVFVLQEDLPQAAQDILWWNPLNHVVALMRSGFYASYEAAFASPLYVILFALAALTVGAGLLRALSGEILEE